jgi:2-polyprenyl-3-methyl-5-hydroxy-6-metoxy-1,4-benzoquinol methylase
VYSQEFHEKFYRRKPEFATPEAQVVRRRRRAAFVRRFRKSGRLLDLGCGQGFFVAAANRAGFQAIGVDVSAWATDFGKKELGLDLRTSSIEDVQFPPASFDIVTMWASLEHAANPATAVERIYSWLTPGGLLIIDVPNYECYDAKKLGAKWDGWCVPHHFWHFTPEVAERLLTRFGFKVIKVRHSASSYVRRRLRSVPVIGWVRRIIMQFYQGTCFRMVAEKPSDL